MKNPKRKNASAAAPRRLERQARGRARCGPIRSTRRPRCTRSSAASRSSGRSRRANSSTSTPSRCWSPWCCRRRRPTPASTRRRARCSRWPTRRRRCWRSARRRVGEYIRTIGLWRGKAKNVIALSQALIRDHGGEVPDDRDVLTTLPGVGRKTANVVLNMAFGQPTMAVDTHIFRLGNRLGLAPGKTPEEVEAGAAARSSRPNTCATRITG